MKIFNYSFVMTKSHLFPKYAGPKRLLLISLALVCCLSSSIAQGFECPIGPGQMEHNQCGALWDLYKDVCGSSCNFSWPDGPRCGGVGIVCAKDENENHYNVTGLYLSNKGLDGVLPDAPFEFLPFLEAIDMSFNSLEGQIPDSIADMEFLHLLFLTQNKLSGSIPEELLGHNAAPPTPSLYHVIDLANNDLTGGLPTDLGSAQTAAFNVSDNPRLRGPVPSTYTHLNEMQNLSYLDTQICEPQDQAMQKWLNDLAIHYGTDIPCGNLKPASIIASDGHSAEQITVTWRESNIAIFYVLQRRDLDDRYQFFDLPHIDYCNEGICRYDDKNVDHPVYDYRVKGCISRKNCSEYTIWNRGYRTSPNDPLIVPRTLLPLLYD